MVAAAALAGVGSARDARASTDVFGYGDGHWGVLSVTAPGTVVNGYAPLAASVAAGASMLPVGSVSPFKSGDLVLVVAVGGLSPARASGSTTPIDLSASSVGRWELARVTSVTGSALALTAPMADAFAATGTQVVDVPEYTDVSIAASASVVAAPWDGTTGGIVAFFARGTITDDGAIAADASGFRGGAFVASPSLATGCTGLDQATPQAGAKGEGIAVGAPGGRGDVANGGGGADCSRSGGAGGGNGGQGGGGGASESADGSRAVGGIGGAPLVFSALTRLTFGGGGGAGQGSSGDGAPGSAGGGVVFLRGVTLAGAGTVSARGGSYVDATGHALRAGVDGAGGGGAGGTIALRFVGAIACAALDVGGGDGAGIASEGHGPGGGGAGGHLLAQAKTV